MSRGLITRRWGGNRATHLLSEGELSNRYAVTKHQETKEQWRDWPWPCCTSVIYVVIHDWKAGREVCILCTYSQYTMVTEIWTVLLRNWCYLTKLWNLGILGIVQWELPIGSVEKRNRRGKKIRISEARGYFIKTKMARSGTKNKEVWGTGSTTTEVSAPSILLSGRRGGWKPRGQVMQHREGENTVAGQ